MSLVPILYTSLIVFTILMVVVLTISYIAYKVKNRSTGRSQNREETYDYLTRPRRMSTQEQTQSNRIRVVPTIKNPELRRSAPPSVVSARRTKVINSNEFNSSTSASKRNFSEESNYSSGRDSIGMSRTTAGSYNQRVEVLNKVIPKDEPREDFNVGGSGTIVLPKNYSDFRAIQYYTDDEDDYYYKPNRHYD